MMFRTLGYVIAAVLLVFGSYSLAETKVTCNDITWTFSEDCKVGKFVNGEYWVIGPVKITAITNTLNSKDFTPKKGQNGSMINPDGKGLQGYDSGARSYREELNAALPNGKPVSTGNPLVLKPGQSLVSMVSWLYRTKDDREPGCPRWYATNTPRPAVRSGAVLTCLDKVPPEDSFRPPYCGNKKVQYAKKDLKIDLLKKLKPVGKIPDIDRLEKAMSRTWFDHVPNWSGAVFHPSDNMPNYGREMGHIIINTALLLHVDFDQLPGKPKKDKLLVNFVQFGIDLLAIADNGGSWKSDGGHGMGRKWPILFAGVMLGDEHMQNIGKRDILFQEDGQTFYVSQKEVDITNGPKWKPDRRSPVEPYTKKDIGTPEWGIRHRAEPNRDNRHWKATYRAINNSIIPGLVLAARIMGQKKAWNHDALFDYADRVMKIDGGQNDGKPGTNSLPPFPAAMWKAYREKF
jgi:hypothetical protein